MGGGEPNGSGVGLTVRELVLEIREDVRALQDHIDRIDRTGSIGTKKELDDHEQRLRDVESWKSKIPVVGIMAGIAVLLEIHTKFAG